MTNPVSNLNRHFFGRAMQEVLPDVLIAPCVALLLGVVVTWAHVGFGEDSSVIDQAWSIKRD
jgi:hypothetical protein